MNDELIQTLNDDVAALQTKQAQHQGAIDAAQADSAAKKADIAANDALVASQSQAVAAYQVAIDDQVALIAKLSPPPAPAPAPEPAPVEPPAEPVVVAEGGIS